jgi:branched-chain amino acid transport system ATP-binding protein
VTLLAVRDLHVGYGGATALAGVSLEVAEGEVVSVIGANGAGKTTMLKAVSGVAETGKRVSGGIEFEGRRIERLPAHRIARLGVTHVPEGRRVFPQSSVEENLLLGAYRRRRTADLGREVAAVYERFPVLGTRRAQPAGLLSGGEQQLLALGRALMARPRLLLLDEPSLGLAPLRVAEVFDGIRGLAAEGVTILLVEQLATKALAVADRAYVLETGIVTRSGPAEELARDPAVRAAYLGA